MENKSLQKIVDHKFEFLRDRMDTGTFEISKSIAKVCAAEYALLEVTSTIKKSFESIDSALSHFRRS